MKKSAVLVGIFAPLYYELVFNLMMYMMLYTEYSERYAFIQNLMIYLLPALPGIAVALVLVKNSLKDYFKSLGICFLISMIVFLIYGALHIDLSIFKAITGYDEFSNVDGLLFVIMFLSYAVSCTIGAFVSGIISLCRQIKSRKSNK